MQVEDQSVPVLDVGYVTYIRHMGDDLGVVNDLRASFMKRSDVWSPRDAKLLRSAFRRREFSAWRHQVITLEVKAPMMVARQLYKYSVASSQREDQFGWNEASRRYVTLPPEFYVPQADQWRSAPQNKKQGSSEPIPADPDGMYFTDELRLYITEGLSYYNAALDRGIAPEQARGFLPAYFLYTTWHWTMSLNALCLVLFERLPHEAQEETRDYGLAIRNIANLIWPHTIGALEEMVYDAATSH